MWVPNATMGRWDQNSTNDAHDLACNGTLTTASINMVSSLPWLHSTTGKECDTECHVNRSEPSGALPLEQPPSPRRNPRRSSPGQPTVDQTRKQRAHNLWYLNIYTTTHNQQHFPGVSIPEYIIPKLGRALSMQRVSRHNGPRKYKAKDG